jgi:hypothetical protein
MSDYLGNLVERSFAPIPAVRPVIPSKFESPLITAPIDRADETGLSVDSELSASLHRPDSMSPAPNAAHDTNHRASEQFIGNFAARAQGKNSVETPAPFSPVAAISSPSKNSDIALHDAKNRDPAGASLPRRMRPADASEASVQDIGAARQFSPEVLPGTSLAEKTLRDGDSRRVSPAGRKENAPARSREIPAPSPTIQVTIGRVEIKATTSSPAPSPKTAGKGPAMSLENYLQRRSNGGRDE